MLALTTLIIGISNPVLQREVPSTGSDYVIALDSSSSMLTSDLETSRLNSAKAVSDDFIIETSNSTRIGAVSFSGRINNETELTSDHERIRAFIRNVEAGGYAGTAIGDAVYTSTTILSDSQNNRTVILITDGVNNRGIDLNDSIEYAQDNRVKVNAIGIGSQQNESFEEPGNESRISYPNLDTEGLERISSETGGNFTTVTSESGLRDALLSVERSTVQTDFSDPLILLALLLFLGEWALGTTRYDILP
jgi:Ca-activated chloride channel family protein